VPAPVGGWNARDSLGAMAPDDAVTLTNFLPQTTSVNLRKGYTKHVTGITGQVETLMAYSSGSTNTLFGAATTKIYDVTSAGAVGAASKSSMTNARYQYVNFTTSSGSFLLAVNAADKLIGWNGSAWYVDGDGSHDITNVDTATCADIAIFKNRIWLIPTASLKVWYLPINAIAGAAVALDMSTLCMKGGYIMAAMTWTIDAGYGMDDYLVFVTSNGEVLVWRLTDPTAPTGIALIGIYEIGSPIGRRCWLKYAGDLLLITQDGVVPMSGALQSSRLNPRINVTDKIQFAVSTAISNYSTNFGWQLLNFPKENQLWLNVPVMEGGTQQQYVQNNITRMWANYTGWNANCWEIFGDNPYFGGNGFVGHAWNGTSDANTAIPGTAIQSFQAYGSASQKRCHMIRYHFLTDGVPSIFGDVNVDFDITNHSAPLTTSNTSYGTWDSSVWDGSIYGGNLVPSQIWQSATGIGYSFAPFLETAGEGIQVDWVSSDLVFEGGGTL
jgi:hypothetical protein